MSKKSNRKQIKKKTILRVGTDCSGIEAPIQALIKLKVPFKHVFSSEIDNYCIESIKANYKPDIIYNNIMKRNNKLIPDIDLYVCGFPCQPFSMAGERRGTKDKRGNIFKYCLDTIKNKCPKYFILENVKGILSIDNGKTIKNILKSLEKINKYHIYINLLNTRDYGIPQNRERVYIVGIKKTIKGSDKWKFPPKKNIKSLKNYIDFSDKNKKQKLSNRVIYMIKNIPKNAIFIDLAFKQAKYPNSDIYTPALVRNGLLWCVPLKRYANIKEMLKLQGFPKKFKQVVSTTNLKRQIGNSMSVNVLESIIKSLKIK